MSNVHCQEEKQGSWFRQCDILSTWQRILSERNLHEYFEKEPERALQGGWTAQRSWERRNSDIAVNETNQQIESQLIGAVSGESTGWSGSQWKQLIIWRTEIKNRIFQEHHSRDFVNKYRNYKEFAVSKRTESDNCKIDTLSTRKKENPSTVNQLLSQIQELQDKVNSLKEEKEFYDLECPTFPVKPREFRVKNVRLPAILDCRTTHGIGWVLREMFSKIHTVQVGHLHCSSKLQRIWHHHLANWDQVTLKVPLDIERDWDENRGVQRYRLLDIPRNMRPGILCIVLEELILKFVRCFSEVHYLVIACRKIPRTRWLSMLESQLQGWSVRVSAPFPQLTMSWMNEVEMAKINRRSFDVAINWRAQKLPRLREMLDAKIASALKKILTSVHFRRRVGVEGQRLKNKIESWEGGKLLTWSMATSSPPELSIQLKLKAYQICSMFASKKMTSKISIQDAITS